MLRTLVRDRSFFLEGVEYPTYFHPVQAPVHLNYICALNDIRGPTLSSGFTYCELGCGPGLTSYILAAANPLGNFVGIDLSSKQITRATDRARAGGLGNVRYIAADISDFESLDLPEFDVITLHGLYAWVDAKTRAHIRRFIDAKLRTGGLVYLSYNAMPGWGSAATIRRFFEDMVPRLDGDPVAKTAVILDKLANLQENGALLFADNESVQSYFTGLKDGDLRYIAHEFLSPAFEPMYFADVNRGMEQIGLRYIGDGEILQNLIRYSTVPRFIEILQQIPERTEREATKDFIQNRFFRRDVYVRPGPTDVEPHPLPHYRPPQTKNRVAVLGLSSIWFSLNPASKLMTHLS